MQNTTNEESVSLLQDGKEEVNFPLDERQSSGKGYLERTQRSSLRYILIAIIALYLLDVAAFSYVAHVTLGTMRPDRELELRSSYVGLDELYSLGGKNTSTHRPLLNRPRLAAPVTSLHPDQTYPEDQLRWMSNTGMLSPADLHLSVSENIHTVYQFRVIDYGMERCQLALRLPALDATTEHPWSFPSNHDTLELQVCQLDAPRLLDPQTLSWSTRPACTKMVGTLTAAPGKEAHLPEFPCSWGLYITYEISCTPQSHDCALDLRPAHNETLGIFMYQYQTV